MPSTPFICCSSGDGHGLGDDLRIGARDTPRARRPSAARRSGYSLIGSCSSASAPATTISSERTTAKIGRVMKKRRELHRATCPSRRTVGVDARHAGPHPLQAVDDDEFAGREPLAHDAQAVDERSERDRPRLDLLVAADDQHEARDRDRCRRRGPRRARRDSDAVPGSRSRTNSPGVRRRSGLRKTARPLIVPVERIELVVEKLQRALVRERLLVGQRHLDRQIALRAPAPAGGRGRRSAGTSARRRRTRRRSDPPTRPSSAASPRPGRPTRDCRA